LPRNPVLDVFLTFLRLGATSFGGPVAHLAFFREVFVRERRWLDERGYAELVALCQFLPGPSSSQVGVAIGLHRAGLRGAIAAWVAFTLPSAVIMIGVGVSLGYIDLVTWGGVLKGLKIAAVAVVAHALWGMARALCPDSSRLALAALSALVVFLAPTALGQIAAIMLGALLAPLFVPALSAGSGESLRVPYGQRTSLMAAGMFVLLLTGLPLAVMLAPDGLWLTMLDANYRSGALVFGGGHVVLPLLQAEMVGPGLVEQDRFLAGYGVAQAMPGPLFSFGGFLGASAGGAGMGLLALLAIFLPGTLLVVAVLPFWDRLRMLRGVRRVLGGVNAAVVGLLAAALANPILPAGIQSIGDGVMALLALVVIASRRVPVWLIVIACGFGGLALHGLEGG